MKRALPVLLIALGCSEILTPSRTPRYLSDLGGEVFRWPSDRLPVRYFADTRGMMPALVRTSLEVWEAQFLYGEFKGAMVPDSSAVDVIVIWQDSIPPDVPPDTAGALGACDGVTSFVIDSTGAMTEPIRVQLRVHTLGILTHSPATTDLMYGTPATDTPTNRDRNTAQVLYHTTSTIAPPPR